MTKQLREILGSMIASGTVVTMAVSGCSDDSNSLAVAAMEPIAAVALEHRAKDYRYIALQHPERIEVREGEAWVATFTVGSHTVTSHGPERTFSEEGAPGAVTHEVWVRTLPAPFGGVVDTLWLAGALDANKKEVPDVLANAMEYVTGVPRVDGKIRTGDADFGPADGRGGRSEGSDFNDYLGISRFYPSRNIIDHPEPSRSYAVDPAGYVRLVFGFRHSMAGYGYADTLPLSLDPDIFRSTLPRHPDQICDSALGMMIIPNTGSMIVDFRGLNAGDLLFFDLDTSRKDKRRIDHVAIYLGVDANGRHRFLSSRREPNGPGMGDVGEPPVLNRYVRSAQGKLYEPALYTRAFRAARRV